MEVRRILVVRSSALGDVVHALPAVAALRSLFPAASIDWLVEPAGGQVLRAQPDLDRVFVFDRPRWKRELRRPAAWPGLVRDLARLLAEVRSRRFDLVIDFQCNFRSGLWVLLSGGRRRLGFAGADCAEWGGRLFTNEKAAPAPRGIHKVEKNLWLLRHLGAGEAAPPPRLVVPDAERTWAEGIVEALPGKGPVVVLHPAVSRFGDFKRWPADRFRALADVARRELDARILITWGPGEREAAEEVGRPTLAPATRTALDLLALLSAADAVVAADTGPLHLAAALGKPVVGLYGPKDSRIYGPYPRGGRSAAIQSDVPCSPCRLRRCEHRICMAVISPEEVLAELRQALRCSQEDRPGSSPDRPAGTEPEARPLPGRGS